MDESINKLQWQLSEFAAQRNWDQFHTPKNLAMAIVVEAGELVEHFQWLTSEESYLGPSEKRQQVALELADIFLYLLRIAAKLDIDLINAAQEKIALNEIKYPANLVWGKAKKYDEY